MSKVKRKTLLVLIGFLFLTVAVLAAIAKTGNSEKYMFVWASVQAHNSADFLAVVNFDEASSDYGKLIKTVPIPNPGSSWNEPHHVGLSQDGKILACGGF